MDLVWKLCLAIANIARQLKQLAGRVSTLEAIPPGSGIFGRVPRVDDVPSPLGLQVLLIENSKALAFEVDGETCFTPLPDECSRGIQTGGFKITDENGRLIWRF